MNNGTVPLIGENIKVVNPLVTFVEEILAGVKAGQISSVGIVFAPTAGGFGSHYIGGQKGDLFIGAHDLADKIMKDIRTPQKVSPIIRAGMM